MTNYVLTYKGGGMPQTESEQQAVTAAWATWYESLGAAVADGGNPFGPSMTVASDGSTTEAGASGLTGYTILSVDSLAAAADLAKGCPVLTSGGSVEVYETFRVM
ncbi:MAG TPA: YciI family protein [Actinophytocola sp.]|nr:YciI family protein [Actinophytocola sp.]